jgi:hypothetical protein
MRNYNSIDLIDINKKKGFPRVYKFNAFARWFTIILSLFAIFYAIWYVFAAVDANTAFFRKIIPFVIIFFAANSLFRNLFSLNSILFKQDEIVFRFIMPKDVHISWQNIDKLSLYEGKSRAIQIEYTEGERKRTLVITMNFPNMLEIINSIAELCPELELDDFMKNVVISDKEKQKIMKDEKAE